MVLEKPKDKKLPKIEQLKVESDHLINPLKEVGCLLRGLVGDVVNGMISESSRRTGLPANTHSARIDELILSPSDRYLQTT